MNRDMVFVLLMIKKTQTSVLLFFRAKKNPVKCPLCNHFVFWSSEIAIWLISNWDHKLLLNVKINDLSDSLQILQWFDDSLFKNIFWRIRIGRNRFECDYLTQLASFWFILKYANCNLQHDEQIWSLTLHVSIK